MGKGSTVDVDVTHVLEAARPGEGVPAFVRATLDISTSEGGGKRAHFNTPTPWLAPR